MEEKFKKWFEEHAKLDEQHDDHMTKLYGMLEGELPPPPPEPNPRVDVEWWPNRNKTAGVTAFPLTIRPREYIRDLVQYLQENNYNTVSVGAQAWSPAQAKTHPILPSGPVEGPEWHRNLETLLDETARHKDFWVQLIPTFGYKQYDTDPDGQEMAWHRRHARKIIELIRTNGFKHVFISVMNEFKHPLTDDDLGDTDIFDLGTMFRAEGFKVSTDHGGREKDKETGERVWKAYYPQAWLGFDYYCWHPTRNPAPTARQFVKAYQRWPGKTLLYNETECYGSTAELKRYPHLVGKFTMANKGHGSDEDRRWKIRDLKHNIVSVGERSRFFFHSIWLGIRGGLDTPLGWVPKY